MLPVLVALIRWLLMMMMMVVTDVASLLFSDHVQEAVDEARVLLGGAVASLSLNGDRVGMAHGHKQENSRSNYQLVHFLILLLFFFYRKLLNLWWFKSEMMISNPKFDSLFIAKNSPSQIVNAFVKQNKKQNTKLFYSFFFYSNI